VSRATGIVDKPADTHVSHERFDHSDLDGRLLQLLLAVAKSARSRAPPRGWA
jgi:hypothetical protein